MMSRSSAASPKKHTRVTPQTSRGASFASSSFGHTTKAVPSKKAATAYMRTSHKKMKRYAKLALRDLLLSSVFHRTCKLAVVSLFACGLMSVSYVYISKSFANEVVISQSEIISRVSLLTTLPPEEPYEIVRVQDEEALRKQNSFYQEVKEGDYILVYKHMAVIYDLRNNVLVAIKKTK